MMTLPEADRAAFRNAFARQSAGVCIVTTNGPAGRAGLTATAVCSITDTPPTLMVCINRSSAMNAVFKQNARVCVNLLSGAHEEAARHFAGMTDVNMEDRFALDAWDETPGGLPVLSGSLAHFDGRVENIHEVGTHSMLLVAIDGIGVADDGDALIYFERAFHRLARVTAP